MLVNPRVRSILCDHLGALGCPGVKVVSEPEPELAGPDLT